MKLILMRHAEALPNSKDFERVLSPKGISDVKKMTNLLIASNWNAIDEILTSPYIRAVQTKDEIIKNALTSQNLSITKSNISNNLASGASIPPILELLNNYQTEKCVLWIMHVPTIAELTAQLTGIPIFNLYFEPGSMIALNITPKNFIKRSIIIWQYQPNFISE